MMYVYAIADRPQQPLPDQMGLRDQALAKVIWHDVVAVVSTFTGANPSKTAAELWRHEDVVEALMSDRAVLPVRYGTLVPSPRHVVDLLRRAYGVLLQDINRVRDHVEIGMRFWTVTERSNGSGAVCSAGGDRPSAKGPGAAYLCARVARERQLRNRQRDKQRLVREAYERLATHANASRLDDEADDRRATTAAFLVPRDRMVLFRERVGEVANAHPELVLLCTGPWPPYSFVSAGGCATSWGEGRHAG